MKSPTRAVNALAALIHRAQQNGVKTPVGIAVAIDAARMVMSPETAAELDRLRKRVAELEAARPVLYLAEYEGAEPELWTTIEAARDACEDLIGADLTPGGEQGWDWVERDGGVWQQVWTRSLDDMPLSDAPGRVTPVRVQGGDVDHPVALGEPAAEHERVRVERDRYRIAWGMARTRALSAGGAADRYAAHAREGREALQHMLFAVLGAQLSRTAAQREAAALRGRVTELEQVETRLRRLLPTEPCPREGTPVELAREWAWHEVWELVAGVLGVTLPYERPAAEAGKVTRVAAGGITRADEQDAAGLTVYRAEFEHAITPLETYTSRAAARKHCETEAREEEGRERTNFDLMWETDPDDDEVEELWVGTGPDDAERTGYLVRARAIATEYDPEASA